MKVGTYFALCKMSSSSSLFSLWPTGNAGKLLTQNCAIVKWVRPPWLTVLKIFVFSSAHLKCIWERQGSWENVMVASRLPNIASACCRQTRSTWSFLKKNAPKYEKKFYCNSLRQKWVSWSKTREGINPRLPLLTSYHFRLIQFISILITRMQPSGF